jgi:hypothetical protein
MERNIAYEPNSKPFYEFTPQERIDHPVRYAFNTAAGIACAGAAVIFIGYAVVDYWSGFVGAVTGVISGAAGMAAASMPWSGILAAVFAVSFVAAFLQAKRTALPETTVD